jgi:hypothetical protein
MPQFLHPLRRRLAQACACGVLLLGVTVARSASVATASAPSGGRVPSTSRFT